MNFFKFIIIFYNIIINLFYRSNINFYKIVLNKIKLKFKINSKFNNLFLKDYCFGNTKKLCQLIDTNLYKINKGEIKKINFEIKKFLQYVPKLMRYGAADYELLYFLTKKYEPKLILETGVAIGYSTSYFLKALEKNKFGKLYSSDFMYLGIKNSKKYIGYLPKKLGYDHKIFTNGDEFNIPHILKEIKSIDLFHYDSDKSYEGKDKIFKMISNKLSKKAIYVMDDIQDDSFFLDFVKKKNLKYIIIMNKNKDGYIGIAGHFLKKINTNQKNKII